MINSELGTGIPTYDKQLLGVTRKTALRDVHNQKSSTISNHQENLLFLGARPVADPTRVCGTKRLTPERPSNANSNGINEHILNARRRFDLELGKGKIQNNMDKFVEAPHSSKQREIPQTQIQWKEGSNGNFPAATQRHSTPKMTYSHGGPTIANSSKLSPEPMHSLDLKVDDKQLANRFVHLQKFLRQYDESNQTDYIHMLSLSPADLSRHAVDLEKRAIQSTIEEGKEMQRVKALNVLGKSSTQFTNLTQTAPSVMLKK